MKDKKTTLTLVGQDTDGSDNGTRKRLADFIRERTEDIVHEWETFSRSLTPATNEMTPLALRDHIHPILNFVVSDIESAQTGDEQVQKSKGQKAKNPTRTAAEDHAALRLAGGFDIDQMVSEYRALRASVIKLWTAASTEMLPEDFVDLTRFSESIDQALGESVSHYTHEVNNAKHLFLGILGHDLRTPLSVISMSADLIPRVGSLNERQSMLNSQISESASRASQIVSDLLDVVSARFGSGLPINLTAMDFGFVSRQLVNEMRSICPTRTIALEVVGDMKGNWDKARIGQIFTNLIGNAIQYSFEGTSITVNVEGTVEEIVLSVHNEGLPIPVQKIGTIFNPLSRAVSDERDGGAQNLGLGLYITSDIVHSHGGTISVASTEDDGTTFSIRLPRSGKTPPAQTPSTA